MKFVPLATFPLLANLARSYLPEDNALINHLVLNQGNLFHTFILYNPDRTISLLIQTYIQDTQDACIFHIHYTYGTAFFICTLCIPSKPSIPPIVLNTLVYHLLVWDISFHNEDIMVQDLVGLFQKTQAIATKRL